MLHLASPGRVQAIRRSGSKLAFIDISDGRSQLQVKCNLSAIADADQAQFQARVKTIQRGDHIAVRGFPAKAAGGQLSIAAERLPRILSPSLHPVPKSVSSAETLSRRRHLDLIVNPRSRDLLRLRAHIDSFLRRFFDSAGFTSVSTPIMSYGAGGASARPFITEATEFRAVPLSMRIAPELFLKRLVVGDLGPVYEIGPVFRNEGVDATHNPEFTMCEFYLPYAGLDKLLSLTESLFRQLDRSIASHQPKLFPSLDPPALGLPTDGKAFPVIEFVPTLKRIVDERTGLSFSLASPDLNSDLVRIFGALNLDIPEPDGPTGGCTISNLLDGLASHLLEPLCAGTPTWIIHHPAVMSPLAKSFTCPYSGEDLAARAELYFGNGVELVNCYEEENDPISQERKFAVQAGNGRDGRPASIDDSYVEALEWGLPPTAGWGCGIDRLVMYFGGAKRVSEVLAFGSLRNVVTMGRAGRHGLD